MTSSGSSPNAVDRQTHASAASARPGGRLLHTRGAVDALSCETGRGAGHHHTTRNLVNLKPEEQPTRGKRQRQRPDAKGEMEHNRAEQHKIADQHPLPGLDIVKAFVSDRRDDVALGQLGKCHHLELAILETIVRQGRQKHRIEKVDRFRPRQGDANRREQENHPPLRTRLPRVLRLRIKPPTHR